MRIGYLTYGLDRPITGIGRYTLELARALRAALPADELALLTAGRPLALPEAERYRQYRLRGCRLLPALLTLGNLIIPRAARRLGLDILHDPSGVTPLLFGAGPARAVVTIHDVFAWSYPGTSSRLDTLIYRHWLPRVLSRARQVITVSEHSRQEIMRYLRVPVERISVIPYGIGGQFRPLDEAQVRPLLARRFGLDGPYLLYVGALTRRKNVERALEAFAQVGGAFPQLRFVLAGPRVWQGSNIAPLIERHALQQRVLLTGPLSDSDLPALYSAAQAFVFPSLYEGFGLPPLEAMACGAPVITSSVSALPEAVGDAAITVDPHNVDALAAALAEVLSDAGLRAELRARGLARASQFSWERAARETLAIYARALENDQ